MQEVQEGKEFSNITLTVAISPPAVSVSNFVEVGADGRSQHTCIFTARVRTTGR